jgi:hypothetical protein
VETKKQKRTYLCHCLLHFGKHFFTGPSSVHGCQWPRRKGLCDGGKRIVAVFFGSRSYVVVDVVSSW